MPRRRRTSKRRRRELTIGEVIELECGPNPVRRSHLRPVVVDGQTVYSVFVSEADRREAAALYASGHSG